MSRTPSEQNKAMNRPNIPSIVLRSFRCDSSFEGWDIGMVRVQNPEPMSHSENAGLVHAPWLASCGPAHEPPQRVGFGCRVWGLGIFRILGSGFEGFGVQGSDFGVWNSGFRVST